MIDELRVVACDYGMRPVDTLRCGLGLLWVGSGVDHASDVHKVHAHAPIVTPPSAVSVGG